ncbi:MAG: hypothetical protein ABIK65_10455 [Candidatus Eisenbacteria bacterium]
MVDERFLMHRLKSTSLAGVVGGVSLGLWFAYLYYIKHEARWDLFVILLIMAAIKLGAMVYYRNID